MQSHHVGRLAPDDDYDNEFSDAWMRAVARAWASEWNDPREDIYSIDDGLPPEQAG